MSESTRRDVFQAIADPTRRKIIELLADGPMNINALTAKLEMTQPAVSQQVKILGECGIVELEKVGRERYCRIESEKLIPAFLWLEKYQQQWVNRIDSFEEYVNQLQSTTKKK